MNNTSFFIASVNSGSTITGQMTDIGPDGNGVMHNCRELSGAQSDLALHTDHPHNGARNVDIPETRPSDIASSPEELFEEGAQGIHTTSLQSFEEPVDNGDGDMCMGRPIAIPVGTSTDDEEDCTPHYALNTLFFRTQDINVVYDGDGGVVVDEQPGSVWYNTR